MSDWVICEGCGMKHRPTRDGLCPRCERPVHDPEVFTENGRVRPSALDSTLMVAVPIGLVLAGLASVVFLRKLGGSAVDLDSRVAVIGGLLLSLISWVWALGLAWREGLGWFLFGLFVPLVSVMAMGRWKPFLLQLVGVGLLAFGVMVAPAGVLGLRGPLQEVALACRAQPGADAARCACVGQKTLSLMTPEDRQAPFDVDAPAVRALMVTAERVCQLEVLVGRCVSTQRGDPALCTCLMEKAMVVFTPAELDTIERSLAKGALPPIKYDELRTDCAARLRR